MWKSLEDNDIIDIIAPSFRGGERLPAQCERYVQGLGLKPRIPRDLFGNDLLFSNADRVRFKHLKNALLAKDSKAVWCIRGGSGAARLIPELVKLKKPREPKLFIGYSDITALHAFLNQEWGWPTIHGPVLFQMAQDKLTKASKGAIEQVMFGKKEAVSFNNLVPLNKAARTKRNITSSVTGGNLVVTQTSIDTSWQLQTKGKILFLEEVEEYPYAVDRMLTHLHQAGMLVGVRAILLGDMVPGDKIKFSPKVMSQVLEGWAADLSVPVLRLPGVGHGRTNMPLPLGTKAELELGPKVKLTIETK